MIEHIEKVAKLLETSNLEPETMKLINAKLREMLGKLDAAPATPPGNSGQPLDPTTLDEWFNGALPADRGGG